MSELMDLEAAIDKFEKQMGNGGTATTKKESFRSGCL